uniref:Uncharacterized protein n=1 Tax=Siphoviridae sp. ctNiB4 TaxID=2823575 RepID=A0A8S5L7N1_9CAUD|nr:MAG TPA: hypothetical protein [Siphoviridae sp. ctNiB4]
MLDIRQNFVTRRSPVQVWLAAQRKGDAYASPFLFHRFFLPLPD